MGQSISNEKEEERMFGNWADRTLFDFRLPFERPKSPILGLKPTAFDIAKRTPVDWLPNDKYNTPDDVLKFNHLQKLGKIGEGRLGTVYKAMLSISIPPTEDLGSTEVALKVINISGWSEEPNNANAVDTKNELYKLQKIQHPHVVRLLKHFIINQEVYLCLEYADGDSLYRYLIHRNGPLTEDEAKTVFVQISSGLAFMHVRLIAHRDLKPANILLKTLPDGRLSTLIADFGLSRVINFNKPGSAPQTPIGTPAFMAPELKKKLQYDPFSTDMYAMGVMLFVMLQSKYPFDEQDEVMALKQADLPSPLIQWNSKWPLEEDCKFFIRYLMENKAAHRVTMYELVKAPMEWVKNEVMARKRLFPPAIELSSESMKARALQFPSASSPIRHVHKCNYEVKRLGGQNWKSDMGRALHPIQPAAPESRMGKSAESQAKSINNCKGNGSPAKSEAKNKGSPGKSKAKMSPAKGKSEGNQVG